MKNASDQSRRAQEVLKRIEVMGQTAGEVQRNASDSQSSYGETATSVAQLSHSIQEIAQAALSPAEMVSEARKIVEAMGETAQQVAARASLQLEAAEKTAAAAGQMTISIANVADKTSEAEKQSERSRQAAPGGSQRSRSCRRHAGYCREFGADHESLKLSQTLRTRTTLLALNGQSRPRRREHSQGLLPWTPRKYGNCRANAESTKEISVSSRGRGERDRDGADLADRSGRP